MKNKIDLKVLDLFKKDEINFFWISQNIQGVEVNFFIYDKQAYQDFCLLKGNLKGYINFKPSEFQEAYDFKGNLIQFKRNIKSYEVGFLYEKPSLLNNKTYCGMVPRQDFYYSGFIVCENNNFFRNLEKEVWKSTINQLIKEYGININLEKINILNTHFTYQNNRKRISKKIIEKIQKRTKLELNKVIYK